LPSVMTVLKQPAGDDSLAAIFSSAAMPVKSALGDVLPFKLGGDEVNFKAVGSISNFPTLEGAFVIVSLPELAALIDLPASSERAEGIREAWLSVEAAQHAALVRHPQLGGRILDDAQARLRSLQSDALAQGTRGAFQLNTLTLALLSIVGFLLVHYFAAQQRTLEFSVLRSMGLSTGQLLTLLSTEGLLVIALGLLAGTVIGYGLAQTMVSFLSRALSASLGGVRISQVLVDWPAVGQLYLVLAAFYLLAILLLMAALVRVGIHRAMRVGE
ncbi:MAG: ABC transporter permease, partial [Delftia sp.]|nr:ABC transporter permease [Delftia sp.]